MKQPKKLTRQQKILLSNVGLDPDKYMLRQDLMRTIPHRKEVKTPPEITFAASGCRLCAGAATVPRQSLEGRISWK